MMLVHHSRNTAQKQWDETLVLSLNGMGRLLRTHLGAISLLEGKALHYSTPLSQLNLSTVASLVTPHDHSSCISLHSS